MSTIASVTPPHRFRSTGIGAAAAIAAWGAFTLVRDDLPVWLRLVIASSFLVFGAGAGLAARLLQPLSWLSRVVLGFSLGVVFAPIMAHALGAADLVVVYPFVAAAMGGGALGYWRESEKTREAAGSLAPRRLAVLVLVVVTLAMGVMAFAHRLTISPGSQASQSTIAISGSDDYDSYDISYYAAIASELSHTVPPASPFMSGRQLDHAFYPHLMLALIHRFGHVPLLELYFRYGFPLLVTLAVLACFVFVESIASVGTAFLAALFFGVGSNLAYLAVWFMNVGPWDDVIWAHNLQGAGAEVLFYGDWAPAFVATFAGFYALHAAERQARLGWTIVAGAAFATTILSKPWVFAAVLPALALTVLTSLRNKATSRQLVLVAVASVIAGAPFLYRVVTLYDDAQVTFAPAFFPIPLVMAGRVGLLYSFLGPAGTLGFRGAAQSGAAGVLATPLFLASTLGFRMIGLLAFWSCLRHPSRHEPIWRVLAWTIVILWLTSTFIVSVPYHETVQVHQLALFLMAIFASQGVMDLRHPRARVAAAIIALAFAVPSTVQYLHRKWDDPSRPPMAVTEPGEQSVAALLRDTDPERTILLHDRPNDPTLLGILSERRSVLAWAGYVRGHEERQGDVEAFFASPDTARASDILRKYHPTHVVEYLDRDHINPQVRDQLQLVLRKGNVALYRVPETLQ